MVGDSGGLEGEEKYMKGSDRGISMSISVTSRDEDYTGG